LAIIAFISDRAQNEILTDDANARLTNAAQLVADKLDSFVESNLNVVRAEAQAPAIVDYSSLPISERAGSPEEARMNSFLQAISRQSPVYMNSVAILDLNGITLADTIPTNIGLDRSNRYYFQQVLATNLPYASTLEYDTVTGRASLYFAAPIRNHNGELIAVLRKRFDSAILQDFIVRETGLAGESSFAVLLDQNYVRLAHGTNRDLIHKSVVPFDPATLATLQAQRFMPPGKAEDLSTNIPEFKTGLENYQTDPHFAAELNIGGQELEQVAVVKVENQPWLVVFAQPQEIYLAPINAQRQANIITGLFIAALVAAFGVFLSQTLSGPIARLTAVAESIAGGDINIQAKVETGDEIGTLARTFNRMTQQLRDFIASLEERVAARTKDLATVAEVGTATATILETDRLLQEVVDLTKERFNLYHSHIYLLDETGENLVLAKGAGEPGRIMAAEKRSIPMSREQSLVARAARERKGVTINDVTLAPDFLPNPLLPNTRSEMAVPMLVGETLIGVFDIQSDVADRFTDSDINIQTTLASQLASSVQNARSYERSKAQADYETLVNTISQKIQQTSSVEDTLQTAIRELGTALGAARVKAILAGYQDKSNTN
jgi:putative methionine-R-sulfoxide reductase with GAF domain